MQLGFLAAINLLKWKVVKSDFLTMYLLYSGISTTFKLKAKNSMTFPGLLVYSLTKITGR